MSRPFAFIAATLFSLIGLAAEPAVAQAAVKEVFIIYKTHFDIGYSDLARNVVELYRTRMIENTLRVIDANRDLPKDRQFVWTLPGWPMEQILWSGQDPQRKSRIEQAIRDGNLVLHALPFSTHTETMEVEDVVRGLRHSSALARGYGLPPPRGAKTTDVPAQTWVIPTVFRHASIDFLHIGVNDATTAPKTPLLFWWEGPDGSRLVTMLTNTYGTWRDPPAAWPYRAWPAILQTYDNVGPPAPARVKQDLDFYARKYPGVKVHVGQLSDFYDALSREELDRMPVVRGDMPDCWIHGPASSPDGCRAIVTARPLLPATEFLATLNAAWGVKTEKPQEALAAAYEQSLLWSEHTWGLARINFAYKKEGPITKAIPGPEKDINRMLTSWQEHRDYATNVQKILEKPCADQLTALAKHVQVSGKRVVVFNSLPWQRDDVVDVQGDWGPGDVVQTADGQAVASEVEGRLLRFVARGVPSLGYRTYRIVPSQGKTSPASGCRADEKACVIESPAFRAAFDPARGRIVSLFDKRTGREWLDTGQSNDGIGYSYERFSKQQALEYRKRYLVPGWGNSHGDALCRTGIPADQEHVDFTPSKMSFTAKVSPLGVTAAMAGKLSDAVPQTVEIVMTLYRDLPQIDMAVNVDNHGRIDAWPEACWLSMPFEIAGAQFRVGRVGSVVNPVTDFIPNTGRMAYWSNSGVAVFNDEGGVGLMPIDTPLVSLGEPGAMKFDGTYVPTQSRVFVNLQNNVWHTNFRDWFSGRIEARVRLWTFGRFDNASALVMPSMNGKRPLLAVVEDGPGGCLPASQSGLTVSRAGVLVTALGPNPDGKGTILRLWDQTGVSGMLTIGFPQGLCPAKLQPVNLRGETSGEPIVVREGTATISLQAFAPATFLFQP